MLAVYVHNLDPVIHRFTDKIQLRWYGLAYLLAFIAGAWLLEVLSKRRRWVLPRGSAGDFIAAAAIFGVFIGGRLGYMLFYYQDRDWSWMKEDPGAIYRVWDGGMASHGGILGLMIFTLVYSYRKKVSWTGLGDGLCVVAPVGLFFGRMANFINGELYGHVSSAAWAIKFPRALVEMKNAEVLNMPQAFAAAADASPNLAGAYQVYMASSDPHSQSVFFDQLLAEQRHNPAVTHAIEPYLQPRHPSQLYEGLLEGAALFGILWWARNRWPQAPDGVMTGLFFIFYALFRIFGEQFREPDASLVMGMTSGQFLSLFMIAIGCCFLGYAFWRGKTSLPGPGAPEAAAE